MSTAPLGGFSRPQIELPALADGRRLSLGPVEAAGVLGERIAGVGPWAHYGIPGPGLARRLAQPAPGRRVWQVTIDGRPAGAVMIVPDWLLGPYLSMLAVLPEAQNASAGQRLLDWYESAAREEGARQTWLCVSAFNRHAKRFYERNGYTVTAEIDGLLRDGDGEFLMRKRLV